MKLREGGFFAAGAAFAVASSFALTSAFGAAQSAPPTLADAQAANAVVQQYLDSLAAPTPEPTPSSSSPTATPTSTASPTPTSYPSASATSTPSATPTGSIGGATVRYAQPALTNPVTVTIAASGGSYSKASNVDCIFVAPAVITGPVTISGCDDRVFVGAVFGGRTTAPSGSYDSTNRGVRLSDSGSSDTGTDYFEGFWFKPGTYLSDAIQIAFRTTTNRTVVLQNILVQATTYGTKAGVHSDTLQVWGGPKTLKVWGLVATDARYQGAYLDAADGRSLPAQGSGWEFGNVFIKMSGPDVSYALTQREPEWAGTINVGPVYTLGQKYKANNDPGYTSWPTANLFESQAPATDFVPASMWASGSYQP